MYEITPQQLNVFLGLTVSNMKHYDNRYKFIVELMYKTGARANEVLSFDRWDKISNDVFTLQPQKGNNLRIFNTSALPAAFNTNFNIGNDFFNGLSYRQLEYSIHDLYMPNYFIIQDVKRVCHLYRHNFAKQLKLQNKTDQQIADKMGERELRSANKYTYSIIRARYPMDFV